MVRSREDTIAIVKLLCSCVLLLFLLLLLFLFLFLFLFLMMMISTADCVLSTPKRINPLRMTFKCNYVGVVDVVCWN